MHATHSAVSHQPYLATDSNELARQTTKLLIRSLDTWTRVCLRPTAACSNSCFLSQINPCKLKGTLFWPISLSDGLQAEVCFGAERHKRKTPYLSPFLLTPSGLKLSILAYKNKQHYNHQNTTTACSCAISGFHREADENWAFLWYCAASSGNSLQTFRYNLSVPSEDVTCRLSRNVGKKSPLLAA